MLKLHLVTVTTRPGRKGPAISAWLQKIAEDQGVFELKLVDLAEVNLPLFDEPNHPVQQNYVHEHTKKWSALVNEADAFVFVTPEYNFGTPPSLSNALNYLVKEWAYKPVAFVSYGGISGGLRGVQMTKSTVSTLKMVPLVESVTLPLFNQHLKEDGSFAPPEISEKSAVLMLNELHRWAEALKVLR